MNIGQRVKIANQLVVGVCDGAHYGRAIVAELQSLVGCTATIREILRAGYAIEIDGREGLFPVYADEVDA